MIDLRFGNFYTLVHEGEVVLVEYFGQPDSWPVDLAEGECVVVLRDEDNAPNFLMVEETSLARPQSKRVGVFNNVSGSVGGMVIQAGNIDGPVQF